MAEEKMLIWLPSPLGDAVMATPALRAFRTGFSSAHITFLASAAVRQVLSPSPFCNDWLDLQPSFLQNIRSIRRGRFQTCILLKNSFGSALTAALAGISSRIGYARDGRTGLLTRPVRPLKDSSGRFVPIPAIDYYLNIARFLGIEASDRTMELPLDFSDEERLRRNLPAFFSHEGPKVILVPGGAFGPSKWWPPERFAQTADALKEQYGAMVILSIAPNPAEQWIAQTIRQMARSPILCTADIPLNLSDLKTLIARADLVITNDTGPRHIAVAFKRKVITLFGPNNPQWTQTGWSEEIQIIGQGPCVPCDNPICRQRQHYCMESITVEQVLEAVRRLWKEPSR
ncbi:MAG: glycosyltransferase family 9 protein [Anaerohalosphaeraceae bacterium]